MSGYRYHNPDELIGMNGRVFRMAELVEVCTLIATHEWARKRYIHNLARLLGTGCMTDGPMYPERIGG